MFAKDLILIVYYIHNSFEKSQNHKIIDTFLSCGDYLFRKAVNANFVPAGPEAYETVGSRWVNCENLHVNLFFSLNTLSSHIWTPQSQFIKTWFLWSKPLAVRKTSGRKFSESEFWTLTANQKRFSNQVVRLTVTCKPTALSLLTLFVGISPCSLTNGSRAKFGRFLTEYKEPTSLKNKNSSFSETCWPILLEPFIL